MFNPFEIRLPPQQAAIVDRLKKEYPEQTFSIVELPKPKLPKKQFPGKLPGEKADISDREFIRRILIEQMKRGINL